MNAIDPLEAEIAGWRAFVAGRVAVDGPDVDELESHLRDQIADLCASGLTDDEAFLIAVKRLGGVDELSREFAREHSGRLWHHLVPPTGGTGDNRLLAEALVLAVITAGVTLALSRQAATSEEFPMWVVRNASLLVAPWLACWFVVRDRAAVSTVAWAGGAFALGAAVINLSPHAPDSSSAVLAAAHLPFVAWAIVGFVASGGWRGTHEQRMDVVRFTGEWAIYYVLIALGGGVLLGLTAAVLEPTDIDPVVVFEWVLPAGAGGAVIVAAWLVGSKQRVVENMAPVLTLVFTPLFALMLTVACIAYATSGFGAAFDRELLGLFDALLVVVLGLVLYGISAREPTTGPGWMDRIQLLTIASAMFLDALVLVTMAARIGDLGFTPNRAAALGLNLVLLVNLAGTAWRAWPFVLGRGTFHRIERWQTAYLPVLAGWAAVVVVVLPPVFGFD